MGSEPNQTGRTHSKRQPDGIEPLSSRRETGIWDGGKTGGSHPDATGAACCAGRAREVAFDSETPHPPRPAGSTVILATGLLVVHRTCVLTVVEIALPAGKQEALVESGTHQGQENPLLGLDFSGLRRTECRHSSPRIRGLGRLTPVDSFEGDERGRIGSDPFCQPYRQKRPQKPRRARSRPVAMLFTRRAAVLGLRRLRAVALSRVALKSRRVRFIRRGRRALRRPLAP